MKHAAIRLAAGSGLAALITIIPLHLSTTLEARAQQQRQQQQNVPTPRTADGHPDLSGMWGGGGGGGGDKPDEKGNLTVLFKQRPCSKQQSDLGNCAPGVNCSRW